MPSLEQATKPLDMSRLEKTPQSAHVSAPISEDYEMPNRFLRCPLPGFNSNPDSLRQFGYRGRFPQYRTLPLRNN